MHEGEPRGEDDRVPGEQGVQEVAPEWEYVPEEQRLQKEEGDDVNFPAGQGMTVGGQGGVGEWGRGGVGGVGR